MTGGAAVAAIGHDLHEHVLRARCGRQAAQVRAGTAGQQEATIVGAVIDADDVVQVDRPIHEEQGHCVPRLCRVGECAGIVVRVTMVHLQDVGTYHVHRAIGVRCVVRGGTPG